MIMICWHSEWILILSCGNEHASRIPRCLTPRSLDPMITSLRYLRPLHLAVGRPSSADIVATAEPEHLAYSLGRKRRLRDHDEQRRCNRLSSNTRSARLIGIYLNFQSVHRSICRSSNRCAFAFASDFTEFKIRFLSTATSVS